MTRTSNLLAIATSALFISGSVIADEAFLQTASQAASLHESGVHMVAYYRDQNGRFDVHATFSDELSEYLPAKLTLAMVDGDDIQFHALGRPEISFRFVRVGSVIEVSTQALDASATGTTSQIQ